MSPAICGTGGKREPSPNVKRSIGSVPSSVPGLHSTFGATFALPNGLLPNETSALNSGTLRRPPPAYRINTCFAAPNPGVDCAKLFFTQNQGPASAPAAAPLSNVRRDSFMAVTSVSQELDTA